MKIAFLALALGAAAAAAEVPESDDPIGRMRAAHAGDSGVRTPQMQQEILRVAQSEALRYHIGSPAQMSAAVAGSAWVNLGPTTADYEVNGDTYFKVDSGRARKILVDPRNADVVYLATSGGGVWKTRNATTASPAWAPITDGIVSLSVGSLAMNPAAPDSLVLGLGDAFDVAVPGFSIVTSDDGGLTWSSAAALQGTYPGSAGVYTASRVRDLAIDPGGAIVLAATDVGLFRHSGGGVGPGWTLVDVDSTTHDLQDCWSLAYAGADSWVLTCRDAFNGYAGKIWRSTDDGVSWTDQTSALGSEGSDVSRITVASASQGAGVPWRVYALAENKAESDQKDVFRSDNGGASWASLAMHASSAASTSEVPLNKTDDQPDLDFVHNQAFYNQMLVVDPGNPDAVFIGGNLSMGRSTNGGASWMVMTDWLPWTLQTNTGGLDTNPNTMAQYAHADWHTATIARVGGVAYFWGGNDGGLIRPVGDFLLGAPGSVTWDDKVNRGIASHLVYSVASGKERLSTSCTGGGGDIIYGGFQDNGTRLRILSGASSYVGYNQIAGGDGFGVGLGCTAAGAAMGSQLLRTYVSRIDTSSDGGQSFTQRVSQSGMGLSPAIQLDPNLTFVMKVVTDLSTDFTYLTPLTRASALDGWVYRSTDNGVSWQSINGKIHVVGSTTPATVFPKAMRNVTAHLRVQNMYAAVSAGRVYVTTDGGGNWYESKPAYSTSTGYLSMAAVAFDPNDTTGGTVWIGSPFTSMSDGSAVPTSQPHLYKCTGAASTTAPATCTGISGTSGLPAVLPVNAIKLDPGNSNVIYVGTEIGLYRSTDGGASFARYGTGLPLVSVTDIAVNADDSAIRVSTFGRGFWEIYPNDSAVGVAGNGDLDNSGVLDGFDLVREAAIEGSDRTTAGFNPVGDVLFNNVIDESDLAQLLGRLGGTP